MAPVAFVAVPFWILCALGLIAMITVRGVTDRWRPAVLVALGTMPLLVVAALFLVGDGR